MKTAHLCPRKTDAKRRGAKLPNLAKKLGKVHAGLTGHVTLVPFLLCVMIDKGMYATATLV